MLCQATCTRSAAKKYSRTPGTKVSPGAIGDVCEDPVGVCEHIDSGRSKLGLPHVDEVTALELIDRPSASGEIVVLTATAGSCGQHGPGILPAARHPVRTVTKSAAPIRSQNPEDRHGLPNQQCIPGGELHPRPHQPRAAQRLRTVRLRGGAKRTRHGQATFPEIRSRPTFQASIPLIVTRCFVGRHQRASSPPASSPWPPPLSAACGGSLPRSGAGALPNAGHPPAGPAPTARHPHAALLRRRQHRAPDNQMIPKSQGRCPLRLPRPSSPDPPQWSPQTLPLRRHDEN